MTNNPRLTIPATPAAKVRALIEAQRKDVAPVFYDPQKIDEILKNYLYVCH